MKIKIPINYDEIKKEEVIVLANLPEEKPIGRKLIPEK